VPLLPRPELPHHVGVSNNHVHTCGVTFPGAVLRGNLIHAMRRSRFACGSPNNGIFFDEGSKGFLVEGNVIYETAGKAVRFNRSKKEWHTWRDNVLGEKPAAARLEAIRATAGPGPKRP